MLTHEGIPHCASSHTSPANTSERDKRESMFFSPGDMKKAPEINSEKYLVLDWNGPIGKHRNTSQCVEFQLH